jgi:orotidine-5'-phosphate decarboxylase
MKPLLFAAFDLSSPEAVLNLAQRLPWNDERIGAKFGLETITMGYVSMITPPDEETAIANLRALRKAHQIIGPDRIGIDLKLGDTPRTNIAAIEQVRKLEPAWINFLPTTGPAGLKECAIALKGIPGYLVPVLTTVSNADSIAMYRAGTKTIVPRLAKIGIEAGLNIITSIPDGKRLRQMPDFDDVDILSPGGKLKAESSSRGHQRSATFAEGAQWGINHFVVGREMNEANDPRAIAEKILKAIDY